MNEDLLQILVRKDRDQDWPHSLSSENCLKTNILPLDTVRALRNSTSKKEKRNENKEIANSPPPTCVASHEEYLKIYRRMHTCLRVYILKCDSSVFSYKENSVANSKSSVQRMGFEKYAFESRRNARAIATHQPEVKRESAFSGRVSDRAPLSSDPQTLGNTHVRSS